ncbi:hypothetical protein SNE40_012434 [Patella caerulea]|uniref:Uncharacterized protein n=1 Tax=Patella caerulea TaxID=87958 RepID=A0AAN8JRK7_PATCE
MSHLSVLILFLGITDAIAADNVLYNKFQRREMTPIDPEGMSDVYDLMRRRRVWEKMDGWERPAVESRVIKQEVQVFEFHARFTVDPTQQYEISSVDFVANTDLMNIYVKVEHGGTGLYLQANNCGR